MKASELTCQILLVFSSGRPDGLGGFEETNTSVRKWSAFSSTAQNEFTKSVFSIRPSEIDPEKVQKIVRLFDGSVHKVVSVQQSRDRVEFSTVRDNKQGRQL